MHSIAALNIRSAVPRGVSAKLGFGFCFLDDGGVRVTTVCFRGMQAGVSGYDDSRGTDLINPR
jgi:hypothetical protein